MARMPSDPNKDGTAYASVLTDYVDWTYASPPKEPPAGDAAAAARSGAQWARWVKEVLVQVLNQELQNEKDPVRKSALQSAHAHITGKWQDT